MATSISNLTWMYWWIAEYRVSYVDMSPLTDVWCIPKPLADMQLANISHPEMRHFETI